MQASVCVCSQLLQGSTCVLAKTRQRWLQSAHLLYSERAALVRESDGGLVHTSDRSSAMQPTSVTYILKLGAYWRAAAVGAASGAGYHGPTSLSNQ